MHASPRQALLACVTSLLVLLAIVPSAGAATPSLAAPTGVTVRPGTSTAIISWNKAANASHYRVCLRTTPTQSPCAQLSDRITATTWSARGLKARSGVDYYVVVYSYRGADHATSTRRSFELKAPTTPAIPAGITQKVTAQTLTVNWVAAKNARFYAVCLTEVYSTETCTRTTSKATALTARFSSLKPTPGRDFYYRVYAYNGTASSRSSKKQVDLPVLPVTGVTVTPGVSGVAKMRWNPAINAESYEYQLATNSSMTSGVKNYRATGISSSPSGLVLGQRYYYRVRGVNGDRRGAYSTLNYFHLPTEPSRVFVLTYNLCGQDKCVTPANNMKKWSTRKSYAGKLARSAESGIIATQESHATDTQFITQLPGYGLAAYYSAKSLFYDKAKYDVIRSGTITLNSKEKKYAVWAEFRDKKTRTVFIVVDAHLQPFKGKTNDDLRAAQTKVLLSRVNGINTSKLPVIYAGDFNSNKSNADQSRYTGGYDAPYKLFTAAGIKDLFDTSPKLVNPTWNSSNQAKNPPTRHSDHIDHVFASPDVIPEQWKVLVSLNGSNYATPFATDHNPVRAIVTVPGR